MRETPSKMHMNDMVNIDTIVFEIICGGGGGGELSEAISGSL